MIAVDEILMGRIKYEELEKKGLKKNFDRLLYTMIILRFKSGLIMVSRSGYRTAEINKRDGGSKHSNHMKCLAVDVEDLDGKIWAWCMANIDLLEKLGVYLEHRDYTPTWVHFQIVPPKSKNRVFIPY